MQRELAPADVDRFRVLTAQHLGLRFDDGKLTFLGETLRDRLGATGVPVAQYLQNLEAGNGAAHAELRALASELTVTETYFFRNREQLQAFQDACVTPGAQGIRLLSAGCASGEEPFSLAISVLERWPEASAPQVSIQAVDVNPAMLARARAGRFSRWSLRETSVEIQQRWFRTDGPDFVLSDRVRGLVAFEERNLISEDSAFWRPQSFEVVFCRNVLMYLTVEQGRAIVARIARSLVPGGLLFLGYAETLRNLSLDFHLRHTHGTFYYQLREGADRVVGQEDLAESWRPAAPLAELLDHGASWVDAIQRASDRVLDLSRQAATLSDPPAVEPSAVERRPGPNLGGALHSLREERFGEALTRLGELQPELQGDPDVLELRAALLMHLGERAEAERLAFELLEIDELNAGAHYVLALCSEHAGARDAAIDHDRLAIYLDPTFSMPRLHLAILAKRVSQRDVARQEFTQALALIEREDASRLLLFGGGFGREALLALCRAELVSLGGTS